MFKLCFHKWIVIYQQPKYKYFQCSKCDKIRTIELFKGGYQPKIKKMEWIKMNKETVSKWLRTETEKLEKDIQKIDKNIIKIMEEANVGSLDKLNGLNIKRKEILSQQLKLYEMLGRADRELDSLESEDK